MKYYLIGIKGAGLSALALILNDMGHQVVGYDDETSHQFTEDKLIERGIKIYTDSSMELDSNIVVVRSTAIKMDHPELKRVHEFGLKTYEYYEMLGRLTKMFKTVTVAGCHGKTTTSSMMSLVFKDILGANYLIGDGTGFAMPSNKWFILEACEYYRHFLNYESDYAIITNIDFDHVDYFKDIDDVIDAYREYANNAEKMVIACGDDQYTRSLEINKPIFFYGINEGNDIIAKDIEYHDKGVKFDVEIEDNFYGHFDLPIFGKHMLLNSLAVIGLGYYLRLEAKDIAKQLKQFKGALRRFSETVIDETVIIDDYAHHPNEVKATIQAAKQKYPNKKIIAVFEPHTFSRTQEFSKELATVLNKADESYILDIFYAREKQEDYEGVTSNIIIENLNNGHHLGNSESDKLLKHKNSVILFMSPKEIKLKDELIKKLEEK